MRVHIGTDHAGFELKEKVVAHLREAGHDVVDHGAHAYDALDDYPPFCIEAAQAVVSEPDSLGIVIGMATVVMVLLLGLTRVVFAMSRDGLLPRGLSHTGKHGTPVRLQIIVGVVMALIAACCNVGILSDMVNIGTLSAFTLVAISIPIMRKKRPDLERSFKIPGNPWVPILIAIANLWLMVNLSVLTWIRFVVWLIVGFAIYFGYGYRHARLGAGELEVAAQE